MFFLGSSQNAWHNFSQFVWQITAYWECYPGTPSKHGPQLMVPSVKHSDCMGFKPLCVSPVECPSSVTALHPFQCHKITKSHQTWLALQQISWWDQDHAGLAHSRLGLWPQPVGHRKIWSTKSGSWSVLCVWRDSQLLWLLWQSWSNSIQNWWKQLRESTATSASMNSDTERTCKEVFYRLHDIWKLGEPYQNCQFRFAVLLDEYSALLPVFANGE